MADYSGITYEKIDRQMGVFWPCPARTATGTRSTTPGTPRLFEPGSWNPVAKGAGPFYFPDGKARFHAIYYEPPTEDVDADYPVILTTGRVVSMFLSGNQTRRIGPLVDQYPEPLLELHPILAKKHGIADGDWVTVESRRGSLTIRCQVVTTIRPDTVFVPYHWPGPKSVNLATISCRTRCRRSGVQGVRARLSKAQPPSTRADWNRSNELGQFDLTRRVAMANPHPEPGEIIDVTRSAIRRRSRIAATKLVKTGPRGGPARRSGREGHRHAHGPGRGDGPVPGRGGRFHAAGRTHRLTPGRLRRWPRAPRTHFTGWRTRPSW